MHTSMDNSCGCCQDHSRESVMGPSSDSKPSTVDHSLASSSSSDGFRSASSNYFALVEMRSIVMSMSVCAFVRVS